MLMFLTLCLVGVILGGMENIEGKTEWKTLFSTIWEREENRESGKSGRKFSPGPTNFVSPNREEMAEWKTDEEYFVHNALWNQVKKKKKKKKEREPENENCTCTSWKLGMFLKEEDKANKGRG